MNLELAQPRQKSPLSPEPEPYYVHMPGASRDRGYPPFLSRKTGKQQCLNGTWKSSLCTAFGHGLLNGEGDMVGKALA